MLGVISKEGFLESNRFPQVPVYEVYTSPLLHLVYPIAVTGIRVPIVDLAALRAAEHELESSTLLHYWRRWNDHPTVGAVRHLVDFTVHAHPLHYSL
jgi:hypothetical protein